MIRALAALQQVPPEMLSELREDNVLLTARLREAHEVADELRDIAPPLGLFTRYYS
jgi:hypothetical protein